MPAKKLQESMVDLKKCRGFEAMNEVIPWDMGSKFKVLEDGRDNLKPTDDL